jgi:hypothetical protein
MNPSPAARHLRSLGARTASPGLVLALFASALAACTSTSDGDTDVADTPADTPIDDDTDTPSDSDTDPDSDTTIETGWLNQDTSDTDTDTTPDSGDSGGGPPGPPPVDSSLCPFGEELDCNGICFPAYFIGDGTCDDGARFDANFDCVAFNADGGDCADTDAPPPPTAGDCEIFVRTSTGGFAGEIGWELRDAQDNLVVNRPTGSFTVNNVTVGDAIPVNDGRYTIILRDSFGDGWNGARLVVLGPSGGELVNATINQGSRTERSFDVVCPTPDTDTVVDTDDTDVPPPPAYTCGDTQLFVGTAANGQQVGWQLLDTSGTVLVSAPAGTYQSNREYASQAPLTDGWYIFRLSDSGNNGWEGGTYALSDLATGEVRSSGTLLTGSSADFPFFVQCDPAFEPGIPPQVGSIQCAPVIAHTRTAGDADEVGWEILDASGAALISVPPGSYSDFSDIPLPVPELGTGAYTLRMLDAGGDGWEGATLSITDEATGYAFVSAGNAFTSGSELSQGFAMRCPVVPEPPPPPICPPGAITDCTGACWPTSYVGDGACDNGIVSNANFFCQERRWDGGDCGPPP